jgi:hypothetical protein
MSLDIFIDTYTILPYLVSLFILLSKLIFLLSIVSTSHLIPKEGQSGCYFIRSQKFCRLRIQAEFGWTSVEMAKW